MKKYRRFEEFRAAPLPGKPIVTWGVFDGVHRGHQLLLSEVRAWAERAGEQTVVLTFDPPPESVLTGSPVPLLMPVARRARLIEEEGIDHLLVLHFDLELARVSAEDFVRRYVLEYLHPRGICLGFNNRFGHGRQGNISLLRRLAATLKFEVSEASAVMHQNRPLSSSQLRAALERGEVQTAAALLGRPHAAVGEVVRGDRRGATLGFPTANLKPWHEAIPARGVYGCRVRFEGGEYGAVTNIGYRPTFAGKSPEALSSGSPPMILEAHLLDFEGELLGQYVEVEFLFRLRDEKKFKSADAVREQIARDIEAFRARFSVGSISS